MLPTNTKHRTLKIILTLFLFSGLVQDIIAQSVTYQEAGLSFFQNFEPKDYGQDAQNWAIVEDHRGVMYFGNNYGILEFDGGTWRLISTPTHTTIRSMAIDRSGRIYAGLLKDFGYLEPDSIGQMQFKSLKHLVEDNEDFGTVWKIHSTLHGIYFQTFSHLFRLSNGKLTRIDSPPNRFHLSFVVRDTVYINKRGVGLLRVEGDSLKLIPDGEAFAKRGAFAMLPYDEKQMLVGTSQGILIYDGKIFKPFESNANSYLQENRLFPGAKLANGNFAFGTLQGGLAIVDPQGQFLRVLDKSSGLQDNDIKFMFADSKGALWLALNKGISRIETASPFTLYNETNGLEGIVLSVHRHLGEIYAATTEGVFYLQNSNAEIPKFKPISDISYQCYNFLSDGARLLVATNYRVYVIQDHQATLIDSDWNGAYTLVRSKLNKNLIYVGGFNGLAALKWVNNQWVNAGKVEAITERIESVIEDSDGILWLGTMESGAISLEIKLSAGALSAENIKRFGKGKTTPFSQNGQIVFKTNHGLRKLNEQNLFVPDSSLGYMFADSSRAIHRITAGRQGQVWLVTSKGKKSSIGRLQKSAGSFDWKTDIFERVKNLGEVRGIYYDQIGDNLVWFSGDNGIIRYDPQKHNPESAFWTLIREVSVIPQDSLLFGGAGGLPIQPKLKYDNNSLRFKYSATSYDDMSENQFQYFLEGYDKSWSGWTKESQKDYTNLPGKDYQFHVRAKNVYGDLSQASTFQFNISPPWYRSWWAYLFYIFSATLLLIGLVKIRVRALQKRTEELESIVADRTKEVSEQAEKLKEMDILKSRFFANISHEFRTPLTLILGHAEQTIEAPDKDKNRNRLNAIVRNSKRLLSLINQLMDLSKFDAQKMKIKAQADNIVHFTKVMSSAFESLAEQKSIELSFESEHDKIIVYFDHEKLERVLLNLMSNAFKFTPESGKITTQVSATESVATIALQDTGIGISKERLPYIFDRFYQVDDSQTREYEGTGIGLALVKQIIELHHGTIEINSQPGSGTEVKVHLPLGSAHLTSQEIISEHSIFDNESGTITPGTDLVDMQDASPPTAYDENMSGLTDGKGEVILVVEDNEDLRKYICEQLENSNRVFEAENGKGGLDLAFEEIPDLIITDVMMPEIDGFQFVNALRNDERTSHIPIIMLTARASDEAKIEGLETGVDAYLTKPFNAKELQVRVKNLIENRRKLRARFSKATIIKPSEITAKSVDQEFLERVVNTIEEHFEDEGFGAPDLASSVAMSASQLNRKLNALIGQPASKLIRSMRLQRAADLLSQNTGTISEIAYKTCFSDQAHFSRRFKEQFGMSPSEYKLKN